MKETLADYLLHEEAGRVVTSEALKHWYALQHIQNTFVCHASVRPTNRETSMGGYGEEISELT